MSDVIRVKDEYYVHATSAMADDRTRVLKHGESFAIFNRYGDIRSLGLGEQGIYHEGTRFLSRLLFELEGETPLFLSSTVRQDNTLLTVDLSNQDTYRDSQVTIPQDTLHISRAKFLWQRVCYERVALTNYGDQPLTVNFRLLFDADFTDIFEVRGTRRARRGRRNQPVVQDGAVRLSYEGLDGVTRTTVVTCSPPPNECHESEFRFRVRLEPRQPKRFDIMVSCDSGQGPPEQTDYDLAFVEAERSQQSARAAECDVFTSNEQFNEWLNRSMSDVRMMVTETPQGQYPYAGVPWFSTAFGRDGIIAAMEMLWVNPDIARGVLNYLAAHQSEVTDPERAAEPGKILHETRKGEMAALGEIPFRKYYGSVDATPLFVMLAGEYYRASADRKLIETIWPNIEAALSWIDTYGDIDGDGFVEYTRYSSTGLLHQGWKDSHDSVFHADGAPAEHPIALCEVQGYVYAAKLAAGRLARVLGHHQRADELNRQAEQLKDRFARAFWLEDLSTYALALDGQKQPCRIRTSNPGHCLLTRIAQPDHAARIAETLLADTAFSGWGIRTLATTESRYNPMAYHNGSIWPHDNAMIAAGFARYGLTEQALHVLAGLFDTSIFMDLYRLPELFCGFPRRRSEGPTLYPVACLPQTWAAASVFMILGACLGMTVDAPREQLRFDYPALPPYLNRVRLTNLRVGSATVDLSFHRYPDDIGINVLNRDGPVEVVIVK